MTYTPESVGQYPEVRLIPREERCFWKPYSLSVTFYFDEDAEEITRDHRIMGVCFLEMRMLYLQIVRKRAKDHWRVTRIPNWLPEEILVLRFAITYISSVVIISTKQTTLNIWRYHNFSLHLNYENFSKNKNKHEINFVRKINVIILMFTPASDFDNFLIAHTIEV